MARFIDFQFSDEKIQRREHRPESSTIVRKNQKHGISKITPHITSNVNAHKPHT